jgi:predicted O-linked N-acetylglucosamine transferase (SPINDLY family)
MGVPIISLAGNRHAGRVGVSLLNQVGLQEWIARDMGEYIALAAQLARSPQRLADIRQSLRSKMQASQLTQAPLFAEALEAAYATMVTLERQKRRVK